MPLPFFISFTTKSSSWLTAPVMFQCKAFTRGSAYFTMCCCRHLLPKVSSSEVQLLILLKAIHQFIRRVCQIQVTTVCCVTTKTNCCRFFSSTPSVFNLSVWKFYSSFWQAWPCIECECHSPVLTTTPRLPGVLLSLCYAPQLVLPCYEFPQGKVTGLLYCSTHFQVLVLGAGGSFTAAPMAKSETVNQIWSFKKRRYQGKCMFSWEAINRQKHLMFLQVSFIHSFLM